MNIFEYMNSIKSVKKILESKTIKVGKTVDGFNMMAISTDFYLNDNTIFVILPTLYEAQMYYDSISNIVPEEDVLFFPALELLSASMISSSTDFLFERVETINGLLEGKKKIVITNLNAALKYEMNPSVWKNSILELKKDDTYKLEDLVKRLRSMGYEMVYTVCKTGEFSRRGSIIDIFPLNSLNPVRIDFFGDDIDELKEFNFETQRSIGSIDKVTIIPVNELIYDDEGLKIAKDKIYSFMESFELSQIEKEMYERDIIKLENHDNLESLSRYLEFFDSDKKTILDFAENKRIYMVDPVKSKEVYSRAQVDMMDYSDHLGGRSMLSLDLFYDYNKLLNNANVLFEGLRTLDDIDITINAKNIDQYKGNSRLVLNDLSGFKKLTTIVSIENKDRYKKLDELLDENNILLHEVVDLSRIGRGAINAVNFYLPAFQLISDNIVFLNESLIFDNETKHKTARYKSIFKNGTKISKYEELIIGDYVVHYDFGVGRYKGIETVELKGLKRDYISIEYANKTGLYLPLERIKELMKYASYDTEGVVLHEIGDGAWLRAKNKVRKRIHDISDKLIRLYAERENSSGFAFLADSNDQYEFENEFEYELTPDQEKALIDVKRDMEKPRVMDRLVCGDVGYGKTEVALRAAFKAIYSGKQVAVLAPTTILSRQHYQTFKSRMEKYGVKVELLSRMVASKKQKEVIEGLKTGFVDIVIGTHRLLSDEVKYKDLGLLIIDEEQRFGVTHKEKIKELKVNVDCITLSATPIPRTLQMSMMGIKDLSMIETPPKNRYPIQTYVLERNDRVISDAIVKEIARGGQVFYLYNYTETIEDIKLKLETLVPEAKIVIVHGKLSKDEIERRITDYIDQKYNVLLCTTIIETGIDMPLTNTLIIHDSDRLGLSQMYQIRGRVGRSDKIAYAYLMYEPKKVLTSEAEKRLATIKEFNELGSGFKIAMRDLSIRGAGDILGEEQSGFIETVGIDMYTRILDEEIKKKNNPEASEVEKPKEVEFEPVVSRSIDPSYIKSDDLKIVFHQKINKLTSIDELEELERELVDRFGPVSNELLIYMYEKLMDNLAKKIGIYKIERKLDLLALTFTHDASEKLDGKYLFKLLKDDHDARLMHINHEIVMEYMFKNKLVMLIKICDYLKLIDEHHKSLNIESVELIKTEE